MQTGQSGKRGHPGADLCVEGDAAGVPGASQRGGGLDRRGKTEDHFRILAVHLCRRWRCHLHGAGRRV